MENRHEKPPEMRASSKNGSVDDIRPPSLKEPEDEDSKMDLTIEEKPDVTGENKNQPGRSSPEPNCAICLESLQNKSFTDTCSHLFCFKCLMEWSKIKPECPLCKKTFSSIVHNVINKFTYSEYHIHNQVIPKYEVSSSLPRIDHTARFRYRTTRLLGRPLEDEPVYQRQIDSHRMRFAPHSIHRVASTHPPRHNFREIPCENRRRIYDENLWVRVQQENRTRLAYPDFFRQNPACTHRLVPWLNRELSAMLPTNDSHFLSFLLELIISLITRYSMISHEFFQHLQPYLGSRTAHFVHELYSFACSPYEMEMYDRHAIYADSTNSLNINSADTSVQNSGRDDQPGNSEHQLRPRNTTHQFRPRNSDRPITLPPKLVLKRCGQNLWRSFQNPGLSGSNKPARMFASRVLLEDVFAPTDPGPSTSGVGRGEVLDLSTTVVDNSDEEDKDECQIVDVLLPKSQRTPEIVDLSSDDEAQTVQGEQSPHANSFDEISLPSPLPRFSPYSSGFMSPSSDVECVFERVENPFNAYVEDINVTSSDSDVVIDKEIIKIKKSSIIPYTPVKSLGSFVSPSPASPSSGPVSPIYEPSSPIYEPVSPGYAPVSSAVYSAANSPGPQTYSPTSPQYNPCGAWDNKNSTMRTTLKRLHPEDSSSDCSNSGRNRPVIASVITKPSETSKPRSSSIDSPRKRPSFDRQSSTDKDTVSSSDGEFTRKVNQKRLRLRSVVAHYSTRHSSDPQPSSSKPSSSSHRSSHKKHKSKKKKKKHHRKIKAPPSSESD